MHTLTTLLYTKDGMTALHLSSQEGEFDVVCALIEANAYVNLQTKVMQPLWVEYFRCEQCMCVYRMEEEPLT